MTASEWDFKTHHVGSLNARVCVCVTDAEISVVFLTGGDLLCFDWPCRALWTN